MKELANKSRYEKEMINPLMKQIIDTLSLTYCRRRSYRFIKMSGKSTLFPCSFVGMNYFSSRCFIQSVVEFAQCFFRGFDIFILKSFSESFYRLFKRSFPHKIKLVTFFRFF